MAGIINWSRVYIFFSCFLINENLLLLFVLFSVFPKFPWLLQHLQSFSAHLTLTMGYTEG